MNRPTTRPMTREPAVLNSEPAVLNNEPVILDDEPPVDARNKLHHALIALHALTRCPAWILALAIVGVAMLVVWIWHGATRLWPVSLVTGGAYLAALLIDWAWLAALPRLQFSFGPVEPSLVGLMVARLGVGLLPLGGFLLGLPAWTCVWGGVLAHAALAVLILYATGIEPFRLGVTHIELRTSKLPPGKHMRLVQISDLHVERVTRREQALIERVNALHADYILLTGDYLNFSYIFEECAIAHARRVLGALCAREGIYAVRGTHQVDPNALLPVLFEELSIEWLRNRHTTVGQDGWRMTFAGASCSRTREIDLVALEHALADLPADTFTVLLYHTPELVPEAVAGGVDLYLAGHTHGGQLCLPLYGALLTGTDVGKQYESGRYDVDGMTLYVSRGIGMEGMAAPRARFLSPPEIVCIDVIGSP